MVKLAFERVEVSWLVATLHSVKKRRPSATTAFCLMRLLS
jgi:hypothetical protein